MCTQDDFGDEILLKGGRIVTSGKLGFLFIEGVPESLIWKVFGPEVQRHWTWTMVEERGQESIGNGFGPD